MKQILEYLLSKNKAHTFSFSLPDDPHDVADYLLECGFKEIHDLPTNSWFDIWDNLVAAAKEHNVIMFADDDNDWIRFAKKGKISKQNPIFNISGLKSDDEPEFYIESFREDYNKIHEYDEFKSLVEKHFYDC